MVGRSLLVWSRSAHCTIPESMDACFLVVLGGGGGGVLLGSGGGMCCGWNETTHIFKRVASD